MGLCDGFNEIGPRERAQKGTKRRRVSSSFLLPIRVPDLVSLPHCSRYLIFHRLSPVLYSSLLRLRHRSRLLRPLPSLILYRYFPLSLCPSFFQSHKPLDPLSSKPDLKICLHTILLPLPQIYPLLN